VLSARSFRIHAIVVYHSRMRISWKDLDWIPETDRGEIQRRMEKLDGQSGLLERVDFSARAAGASGSFEIRITANAAKRQVIAIRRDSQPARAFYSAFEALERGIVSVLAAQQRSAPAERASAAPRSTPARTEPSRKRRRSRASPAPLGKTMLRWGARTALPLLAASLAAVALVVWFQQTSAMSPARTPAGSERAASEPPVFSAVAQSPVSAPPEADPAFSAVARLNTASRR
jgi:hypothetical protein